MAEQRTVPATQDPVCGMTIDPDIARAKGLTTAHDSHEYAFCGKGCLLEFRDDPDRYVRPDYSPAM